MPGPFDFGEAFNRGLAFGVEATQRKAQIEQRYREQQELAAYRRAIADVQARQLEMSEQKMEEEQRRYEASLVPSITGVEAGGPMGFHPRIEQVPLEVAKYQQGLRAYEDKLQQTRQDELEQAAELEANKAFAAELAGKAGLSLSDEALAGAAGNLGTLGNLAITNLSRSRGGGGGGGGRPSTADERFLEAVMSLPPEERLPFLNGEIAAIDQAARDSGRGLSASEMDMRRQMNLLKKKIELSGEPVPQVQQQTAPVDLLGSRGAVMDRIFSQGARQGAFAQPAATGEGLPTVETRAQFDALEEGTLFVKGGATYRKRGNQLVRVN